MYLNRYHRIARWHLTPQSAYRYQLLRTAGCYRTHRIRYRRQRLQILCHYLRLQALRHRRHRQKLHRVLSLIRACLLRLRSKLHHDRLLN